MTKFCNHCEHPRLDLSKPRTLHLAQWIFDTLVQLGGVVEFQKDLLGVLWQRDRISYGTGQHYVDALASRGFLAVTYHGPGSRWKRVEAVRRPVAPAGHSVRVREDPGHR